MTDRAPDVCPLCAGVIGTVVDTQPDLRFFPEEASFQIVRCNACDLLFTAPRLGMDALLRYYPPAYPEYGDDVEALTADRSSWAVRIDARKAFYGRSLYTEVHGRGVRRVLATLLNSVLRTAGLFAGIYSPEQLPMKHKPGRCLHVGSGNGGRFLRFMRQGWNVVVIDVNPTLMARWRQSPAAVETFGHGIQDAHLASGSCDAIFMTHVIEHLTDPVVDMSRLADWLAPGGTLVCELPMYGTLGWGLRPKDAYYDVPRHTMHFTAQTLSALLSKAGLRVTRTVQTPDGWSFYYGSFKQFCRTGRQVDCSDPNTARPPLRHRLLGWVAWVLRSSGNACVYAVKE